MPAPARIDNLLVKEIYPMRGHSAIRLSTLSSKSLIESFVDLADSIICVYKSGLLLTPGEVLSWTNRIRQLTSTKHKCALMRAVHGDVYSNQRLFRFGLIDDPNCQHCEVNETLNHRLLECELAKQSWAQLESYIDQLGLFPIVHNSIETIVGAGETEFSKLALTLRAELVSRLISTGGRKYNPTAMVKASLQTILVVEKMSPVDKGRLDRIIRD